MAYLYMVLLLLCCMTATEPVGAAVITVVAASEDALTLQQRGLERLNAYVEHVKKTGDLQSQRNLLTEAESALAESNRMLSSTGNWSALALGLTKEGSIYRLQGQRQKAIELYRQAEEAAQKGHDALRQAEALKWRALTELGGKEVGAASKHATEAVKLAETAKDNDALADALNVLGSVQVAQGNIAAAAETANREIETAKKAKEPLARYYAYSQRGEVYYRLSLKCDFEFSFQSCYDALTLARADTEQAVKIARQLGYDGLARLTEQLLADVDDRRLLIKQRERGAEMVQRADIFHPKKPADVLVTENYLAPPEDPERMTGMYEVYKQYKQFRRSAGGFADTTTAGSHYVDGMVSQLQGKNDAALESFLKAIRTLEYDRRAIPDERSRGAFFDNNIDMYYAAVLQLLQRHRDAEAFDMLERSKARAFTDLLASRKVSFSRPEEQAMYAEWQLLSNRIGNLQGQLFELARQPASPETDAKVKKLQDQIRPLEEEYKKTVAKMDAQAPELKNLIVSEPVSLKALQQSMRKEGYQVVEYLLLEHGVIVWHITADSIYVRNVFLPRGEVFKKVSLLRNTLINPGATFDVTTSRELFLFLVQPVLSRISGERVVIIPHEALNNIPFQALQNPADGRYLGERFQISYAPSASVAFALKPSSGLATGRLLAAADPRLPFADSEVVAIAKVFKGEKKVVKDQLVREADLKASIKNFDVIHLAVHGKFEEGDPMLSHLLLGKGDKDDGDLTAAEMYGLPLEKSRLVVLSACETGRVEATHGNENLGMPRALLYAGAGTLVMSSWLVDSAATALWMESFYRSGFSKPLPEAARQALIAVKDRPEYSHPYYWAAFTMIGR